VSPYDNLREGLHLPPWVPTAGLILMAAVARWLRTKPCTAVSFVAALPGAFFPK